MTQKSKTAKSTGRKTPPDPVDVNAGRILKMQRCWKGLSQEKLAQEVNRTAQQIQKYENGTNRMAASMLHKFARILGVPVQAFFAGLDDNRLPSLMAASLTREDIGVLKAYKRIRDITLRRNLRKIIGALGRDNG